MHKLVLLRHGESFGNLENRFTGWTDVGLNIPNGIPLVYELDNDLKPIRHYYLGDADVATQATAAVAAQHKA